MIWTIITIIGAGAVLFFCLKIMFDDGLEGGDDRRIPNRRGKND